MSSGGVVKPSEGRRSLSVDVSLDVSNRSNRKSSSEAKRPRSEGEEDSQGGEKSVAEEDKKLEAKRAYNRVNAARARKRVKDQLVELCQKVETASREQEKLQEKNDELQKLVSSLSEENQALRALILQQQQMTRNVAAAAAARAADDSETMRRFLLERGMSSLSPSLPVSLGGMNEVSSNATVGNATAQLSSLIGLAPGLQQNNNILYHRGHHQGSGNFLLTQPVSPSSQTNNNNLYQFLNPAAGYSSPSKML